jgi:hypothetical protein
VNEHDTAWKRRSLPMRKVPSTIDPTVNAISPHQRFLAWIILCSVVGCAVILYLAIGLNAGSTSTPILPLDDVYIHFQYGKALADGHPLRYNADQPPTSGATSLLYPLILAAGYKLGLQGEHLAGWALAIGALSWIGSAWLVYQIIGRDRPNSHWIALGTALAFALSGSLGWAFMSGMETGLMILLILLTLWTALRLDRRGVLIFSTLVALTRPEGLLIALFALVYMTWDEPSRRDLIRHMPQYAAPLIAGVIQPMVNFIATGSATASGMQSKSFLYNIPPDLNGILRNIIDVVTRTWAELLTGISPNDGLYIVFVLSWLAILALVIGLRDSWRSRRPTPAILILCWLLSLTAAISILETAFWQFKRYQQPMIALLFPLAGWAILAILKLPFQRMAKLIGAVLMLMLISGSLITTVNFVGNYADNVREVASSQIPMARYVAATIPPDAIIGVHDIGVMRYLGDHATYDLVGLTTPGAARAWRNGPGSVYEQMLTSPWRPTYFAIYPDARGLDYFRKTGLFREIVASFPSTNPLHNVASATNSGQFVYKADWTYSTYAAQPWQPYSLAAVSRMKLVDSVNIADLSSEDAHQYRWWEGVHRSGFASEVYEMNYVSCQSLSADPACTVLDGGRLITGGEEMTITTTPDQDLIWITRVHPRNVTTLRIVVNGSQIGVRVIPEIPGQWLEIATLIPASAITGTQTRVRVEANITDPTIGFYMPYYHWFYQGDYQPDTTVMLPGPTATFGKSLMLSGRRLAYNPDTRTVQVDLEWQIDPASDRSGLGDAKVFVHLYDQSGKLVEGAQIDQRPGAGVLPPANWLPGVLRDSYAIPVPGNVSAGKYQVALGLYDPVTGARLPVEGQGSGSENRLFIGTIEIR